jgi:O-antigen/teichoic acid export membrane protein
MDPEGKASASRRIAFGTLARLIGEGVGKVASLAFFVVIARELGEEQFGDFIFAMSASTVFIIVAGLGLQEMVGREIAKDPRRADDLVWNVIAVKVLALVALLVVMTGVVAVQGRSLEIAAVILIVSVGIGFEDQAGTLYAVFNGRERQQYVAFTLIVNRVSTALMGIGAAVAGAGAVTIAILFAAGSGLGVATAYWLMHRFVLRPKVSIQPRAWRTLLRASAPLAVPGILATLSFRTSVVLLGLVAAGSADVGEFGASYRLIEAALFVPAAFNAAALAWFSREAEIARGFEMAIKTVLTLMLPIGLGLALFAETLIEALYGADYGGAVAPLRLLGAMVALWGVNTTVVVVLISRGRPDVYTLPALLALVPNAVLALVLIPGHGAVGAAIAALAGAAVLVTLVLPRTARLVGAGGFVRMFAAPLAAGAVMALCTVALSGLPSIPAAFGSVAAYAAAFLVIEKVFSPGDFAFYSSVARPRVARRSP